MVLGKIIKEKKFGVYGEYRLVNDICFVYEKLYKVKLERLYQGCELSRKQLDYIVDCEGTLLSCADYKVITLTECTEYLNIIATGIWKYSQRTDVKRREIDEDRPVALWGMCDAALHFLKHNSNINPVCIIDNDCHKQGKMFEGILILSPQEAFNRYKNAYVLITSKRKINIRNQLINDLNRKEQIDFSYYSYYGPMNLSAAEMMQKTMYDKPKKVVCSEPFHFAYTEINGEMWTCCYAPGVSAGNLLYDEFTEVWKSVFATIIRLSMVNRTYSFCNSYTCPHLISEDNIDSIQIPEKDYSIAIPDYPTKLSISHDNSCNLYCESCRNEIMVQRGVDKQRSMYISEQLIQQGVLDNVKDIIMAGNGEVFVGAAYRAIFEKGAGCKIKHGSLNIFTNGQLFTEDNWNVITSYWPNREINLVVSIDAACKETYEEIRRNGNWERLVQNLEFASRLRKKGDIKRITFDYVVQKKNIEEMPVFIEKAFKMRCDYIMFSAIANWGTYSEKEYEDVRVSDNNGYVYKEYESILSNIKYSSKRINMGNLHVR